LIFTTINQSLRTVSILFVMIIMNSTHPVASSDALPLSRERGAKTNLSGLG